MLRHVVLFRRSEDTTDEDVAAVMAAIDQLADVVPGIEAMSWGADCSPEGLQRGMTDGFTVDFADAASRDAYLVHPDHQAAGARLVGLSDGGVDGLLVLDWEM
jgi:hypothetical protein